jgi:prepilin-type N-terminal cleavage/methylation domain-containing protein
LLIFGAMFFSPPAPRHRPRSFLAFTLIELMVTISVVAVATSGIMVLSGRVFNLLKSANNTTLASQTLQERLEQIRAAAWTTITSAEIPPADEDTSTEDSTDIADDSSQEVLTDPTEFPDDLTDLEESSPGLVSLFEIAAVSAAGLQDVVTEVTVAKYPEGSTPIKIRREKTGSVTIVSHNKDLVYEDMVRVTVSVSFKSTADGRTRTISGQTIITKSSQ